MLTHPTIDQLRTLKLDGMADAFIELQAQDKARDLAHAEWLALLLDREAASRSTRRFQTRLRAARLRHSQASIEDIAGANSTLITSQLPVEAWHEVIGEPTFADAILDRIVHNAYRFALEGPSMRKLDAAEADSPANGADSANALSTKPTKGTRK
jgi:DNA replication protein DnaC